MTEPTNCVLAVDPGRMKCGLAVVRRAGGSEAQPDFEIVHRGVVGRAEVGEVVRELASRYSPGVILIGNGTTCRECRLVIEKLGVAPVQVVDEKFSTLRARKLYFEHNPPRGLRRLIPISMQTPNRPYDDYVAVILAQSFLTGGV